MTKNDQPIQDELVADHAIDMFIAGYEPLLYANNLGLTPEQVWTVFRDALKHCRSYHGRKGKAGRKQQPTVKLASLAQRERRAHAKLKREKRNG